MREILYRAKRIDNEEWVEGVPIFDGMDEQWRIVTELACLAGIHVTNSSVPRVSQKTICQFIGLYDIKGNKIFEGDIIKHYNNSAEPDSYTLGVIKWNNGQSRYENHDLNHNFYVVNNSCRYEVIGNIFDNPELMDK